LVHWGYLYCHGIDTVVADVEEEESKCVNVEVWKCENE